MTLHPRYSVGIIAIAGAMLIVVGTSHADSAKLELKRAEPGVKSILARTQRQTCMIMEGTDADRELQAAFSQVVKKQPAKYESEHPLRGVMKLGDLTYGFVLDALPVEPEAKDPEEPGKDSQEPEEEAPPEPKGCGRLYFDSNHNGDLTDDKAIEAINPRPKQVLSYLFYDFPRTDLTVEIDGKKADYSFTFHAYSTNRGSAQFGVASLAAAAYREGEINLGGKPTRVVVLDYNSNGRFDDVWKPPTENSRGRPEPGDYVLFGPAPTDKSPQARHYVQKLVDIDGRFYDMKVTGIGDKLEIVPSSIEVGQVTIPSDGFEATIFGDMGLLDIRGDKTKPIPVPVGDWELAWYAFTKTAKGEDDEEAVDSTMKAAATKDCKAIVIRKGETVELAFGPAIRPVVTAAKITNGMSRLELDLLGKGGARLTDLRVDGNRPAPPEFTIIAPDGEVVERGKFKYG